MRTIEVKPTILIVDDSPGAVDQLRDELCTLGCNVSVQKTPEEAIVFVSRSLVDLALLDVCLTPDYAKDRRGIILAEDLAVGQGNRQAFAPESVIVFISRPYILETDAGSVLSMFNRRQGLGLGRNRLAEAYEDKANTERILDLARELLVERGFVVSGEPARITASDISWAHIETQVKRKLETDGVRTRIAPLDQVLRITQSLCRSAFGSTQSLQLSRVSKGRSRSLVLSVECEHQNRLSEFRIVKIAAKATVDMEVRNYRERVPGLFRGGIYPLMTGYSWSRDLGGISYAEIGEVGGLPDTLGDRFWSLSLEAVLELFEDLYERSIVDTAGLRPARLRPFSKSYIDRFWNLRHDAKLHGEVRNILHKSRLFNVRGNQVTASRELGTFRSLRDPVEAVINELPEKRSTGYFEAVVHGDLHPDNILTSESRKYHVIDFAHTTQHHATLDYLIMEVMMRSQALRECLKAAAVQGREQRAILEAVKTWMKIESDLVQDNWEGARKHAEAGWWDASYNKLISVIQWIRASARARNFAEPSVFYHAGFGLACYSFVGLPDDSTMKELLREILLFASSLNLERALDSNDEGGFLRQGLSASDADLVLERAVGAWQGWIMKTTRGILGKLENAALAANSEDRTKLLGIASDAKALLTTYFPKLSVRITQLARRRRTESSSVNGSLDELAELILVRAFFDQTAKMGIKLLPIEEAAGVLERVLKMLIFFFNVIVLFYPVL